MKNLAEFTNQYQVSKTLCFELIPIKETLSTFNSRGILDIDTQRADNYKKMKTTLDKYHKEFIERALSTVSLQGIEDFSKQYENYKREKNKENENNYKKCKDNLRKQIVDAFKNQEGFSNLNNKKLFDDVKKWNKDNALNLYYCEDFEKNTTYFSKYNENRMNMYSIKNQSTSIANRIVDENLPVFIENISIYKKLIETSISDKIPQLEKDFSNILNGLPLNKVFNLSHYSNLLTQNGIKRYNTIIGGKRDECVKTLGINEYINIYNQNHTHSKLPKMKMLYKQILSDEGTLSWSPNQFESASKALEAVNKYSLYISNKNIYKKLQEVIDEIPNCDKAGIFINGNSLGIISKGIFRQHDIVYNALDLSPDNEELKKKKNKYYSIYELQKKLNDYASEYDNLPCNGMDYYDNNCIESFFRIELCKLISEMNEAFKNAESLICTTYDEKYQFSKADIAQIKEYLDSVLKILHLLKPLYLSPTTTLVQDKIFYGTFSSLYEDLKTVTTLYDMVRNFITKKPYSTEKIKLNFDCNNGKLLGGWVDSKTDVSDNGTQHFGYLFRKKNSIGEYDYFLGISANKKLFRTFTNIKEDDKSEYERLEYYQPKTETIYGAAYQGENTYKEDKISLFNIIIKFIEDFGDEILRKEITSYLEQTKDEPTPKKCISIIKDFPIAYNKLLNNAEFNKENNKLICSLQRTLRNMDRIPRVNEIIDKEYDIFSDLMDDIENLAKNKVFTYYHISKHEMDLAFIDANYPLYLFKISNKDLSFEKTYLNGERKSRGRENLHTMFFKAVMEGGNGIYDLGAAEVFYRKKSITEKNQIVHDEGIPIKKKNPLLEGQSSTFNYKIVKDRRFTVDKFQLNFSIVQNYKCPTKSNINEKAFEYIKNNPDINIIGIDRGERNLLYISVINREGKVLQDEKGNWLQYSLNTISGNYLTNNGEKISFDTPYHELLEKKESIKKEQRANWESIESIKDLKSGYLSQAIHHISLLAVKYNAIIVMEDLNNGFKTGRMKVEKQVYQNFEKALINKLNYLVFKDCSADEIGGLYHALQLTDKFISFDELTRQSGFIIYIPAWNTSKIDPVTGFVDFLRPKYKSVNEAKAFFAKFDSIRFNAAKDWFEFAFDYSRFTDEANGTRTKWTICTFGEERYSYSRTINGGHGGYERWNVTEKIKNLFADFNIDIGVPELTPIITSQNSADFFKILIKCLQVTLALRYSYEDNKDFILSPVADINGEFYCSEGRSDGLPQDGDANGAFNIARKGLMVLNRIDSSEKYNNWTTKISNKDWLNFVQTHLG